MKRLPRHYWGLFHSLVLKNVKNHLGKIVWSLIYHGCYWNSHCPRPCGLLKAGGSTPSLPSGRPSDVYPAPETQRSQQMHQLTPPEVLLLFGHSHTRHRCVWMLLPIYPRVPGAAAISGNSLSFSPVTPSAYHLLCLRNTPPDSPPTWKPR